jgi:polyisoprenoid-binding protein YceI
VNDLVCGHIAADGREACDATVTGRLQRREFGISFAYPLVGDDVDLEFTIAAFRVAGEAETEAP